MNREEYLTIKEYAELKGISVQAVYKKLNGTLQPYVEVVEGRKVLKREVLEKTFSTKPSTFNFNVEQPFSTEGLTPSENDSSPCTDKDGPSASTHTEIERINKRNEELIDDLRAQIKEKDAQIKEMNEKVISLFETNQRLMENNQKLQLNYQMLLGDGNSIDNEEVDIQGARVVEEQKSAPEEPPKKKGLFSRLFGL